MKIVSISNCQRILQHGEVSWRDDGFRFFFFLSPPLRRAVPMLPAAVSTSNTDKKMEKEILFRELNFLFARRAVSHI